MPKFAGTGRPRPFEGRLTQTIVKRIRLLFRRVYY